MVGDMGTCMRAFLERYFTHPSRLYIGFSYIIRLNRVFRMLGLCRVLLVSAMVITVTLEKRSHARTHSTNYTAHPLE